MSGFWSGYIILLTAINILACFWLISWTAKKRPGEAGENQTLGHAFDGIEEYNKPMPRWWLNLFYITLVFAIGYLVLYPGMGSYAGTLGWSQTSQYDNEVQEAEQKLAPLFARFEGADPGALGNDPDALALGRSLFANNCATCHGSDARGAVGFPNLVDHDWIWGGDTQNVLTSIRNGRLGVMPPWGAALGDAGVTETTVYVQKLAGQPVDAALAARGAKHYATLCVACHGADGKGNPIMGAPNLTDAIWLYGGNFDAIARSIREGRNGQMPAHGELLGEARVRLVAAWLLAQNEGDKGGASN